MTVFSTPIITDFLRIIAWFIAKLTGWSVSKEKPNLQKAVVIGAPHTSNWDFPLMLMAALLLHLEVNWIGKHTLFKGPMGPIMRWLGGAPINRSATKNFVDAVVEQFNTQEKLVILLAPEGTRKAVPHWKSGFYYMAHLAQVPIVMAAIDYKDKSVNIIKTFTPTGDAEQDIAWMQIEYMRFHAKNPEGYYDYKN